MRPIRRPVALVRALCAVSLCAFCGQCDQLSQFIQSFGYTELRPPSVLLTPGAMVAVKGWHPFQAIPICTAEESLGPDLAPVRSATAQSTAIRRRNLGFKFNANAFDQVRTDNRYENLASLSVSLVNPSILSLRDTDIERYLPRRSPECLSAIARRVAKGDTVTMVTSVLMGDMSIKAEWKRDAQMEGSAKVQALQNLALEWGVSATNVSATQVSATGLVWGIVDDLWLAARTVDELDETQVAPRQKAITVPYATLHQNTRGKVTLHEHRPPRPSAGHPNAPVRRREQPGLAGISPAELMNTYDDLAPYADPAPAPAAPVVAPVAPLSVGAAQGAGLAQPVQEEAPSTSLTLQWKRQRDAYAAQLRAAASVGEPGGQKGDGGPPKT